MLRIVYILNDIVYTRLFYDKDARCFFMTCDEGSCLLVTPKMLKEICKIKRKCST